jgi:hypothetical protein
MMPPILPLANPGKFDYLVKYRPPTKPPDSTILTDREAPPNLLSPDYQARLASVAEEVL